MDFLNNYEGPITHQGILDEIAIRVRDHSNINFFISHIDKAVKEAIAIPVEYRKFDVALYATQTPEQIVILDLFLHWSPKHSQDISPVVVTLSFANNVLSTYDITHNIKSFDVPQLEMGKTTIKWMDGAYAPFDLDGEEMEIDRIKKISQSLLNEEDYTGINAGDMPNFQIDDAPIFERFYDLDNNQKNNLVEPEIIQLSQPEHRIDSVELVHGQLHVLERVTSGQIDQSGQWVPDQVTKKIYAAQDGAIVLLETIKGTHIPERVVPEKVVFDQC